MIEITKIIVKIGDHETELTVEQARELKEVLSNLLGNGKERDVIYVPQPYPVPSRPYRYWVTYPDLTYTKTNWGNSPHSSSYTLELKT